VNIRIALIALAVSLLTSTAFAKTYSYSLESPQYGKQVVTISRSDGANIPVDPRNSDFQRYVVWLRAGNKPTSYSGERASDIRAQVNAQKALIP